MSQPTPALMVDYFVLAMRSEGIDIETIGKVVVTVGLQVAMDESDQEETEKEQQ